MLKNEYLSHGGWGQYCREGEGERGRERERERERERWGRVHLLICIGK